MEWQTHIIRNIPFSDLEKLQNELHQSVRQNPEQAHLVISEPQATFTAGRSSSETDLLWSTSQLSAKGATTFKVSRGGKWTFHGPGQIVAYPILSLAQSKYGAIGVRRFVSDLRLGAIHCLESFGLTPLPQEKPFGIQVDRKKIASFGIAVERGISKHGLALYYQAQSAFFAGIHPCGVPAGPSTSMSQLGVACSWSEVALRLERELKKVLEIRA